FPFNEVDGLILSQISYMNLDSVVPSIDDTMQEISLLEVLDESKLKQACLDTLDQKRNYKLFRLLQKSTRYQGLRANYFSNEFRVDKVVQFCALTFLFDQFVVVGYRGTDITLLGWKENLNMSYLDVIPSQEEAKRYFERVANKTQLPLYLAGHSKGGNLAVYAALSSSKELQDRIIHIYNYDGPGFQTDVFQTEEFKNIQSKITKFTCREAMVGILLYHDEPMEFVKSKGLNIFQHDSYNWSITKDGKLERVKKVNIFSKTFEKSVDDFITAATIDERKDFLEILFHIGMEHPYSTVLDWVRHPIRSFKGMKKRYKTLNPSERLFFKKMIKTYRTIWKKNFKFYLHKTRKGENKNGK
ncbi:MAG: DUF2974 domain-containing protein, partial [Anaeroplasmataceae bacterium]|nr:DUF2974 domain-containing protein [Anaeroplasmataceae bacterium]